jgi:hypothetical protein
MSAARLLAVVIVSLLVAAPTAAATEVRGGSTNGKRSLAGASVGKVQNLHAFLLRKNDAKRKTNSFPRTPAFAWNHLEGARRYEFQLPTSTSFADNGIVWAAKPRAPVAPVPITLPWVTGAKYSWFARVRALVNDEPGPWSKIYGFNVRPPGAPRSLSSGVNPTPGMVRWTPVNGATAYEIVMLFDQSSGTTKRIRTATTAADLREYYAFHNTYPAGQPVFWRVRAIREVAGKTKNKLPAVSFGPWSARFRTIEPTFNTGPPKSVGAISPSSKSDVFNAIQSGAPGKGPHGLNPGFYFTGARGPSGEAYGECPLLASLFGITCPLYHVYVFTDRTCANRVHVSDLVGSPAYVPRLTPPLDLPKNTDDLAEAPFVFLADGTEGFVFTAGDDPVTASRAEEPLDPDAAEDGGSEDASEEQTGDEAEAQAQAQAQTSPGSAPGAGGAVTLRRNNLWDLDWPSARYVWTVVPIVPFLTPAGDVYYKDVAFPEDMCAEGKAISFGKTSEVVMTTESGVPFASGLSKSGKVVSGSGEVPEFFQRIVVAWKPAVAANKYEVQFSKKKKAWKTLKRKFTVGTQLQVKLAPGTWYCRVRGLDLSLPGSPGLAWSDPVEVEMVAPTFTIVSN